MSDDLKAGDRVIFTAGGQAQWRRRKCTGTVISVYAHHVYGPMINVRMDDRENTEKFAAGWFHKWPESKSNPAPAVAINGEMK